MVHKVLLVTDDDTGDEAMYLDGKKVYEEVTFYAVDIAEALKGKTVEIEHKTVYQFLGPDEPFPELAEYLVFEIPEFDANNLTASESEDPDELLIDPEGPEA